MSIEHTGKQGETNVSRKRTAICPTMFLIAIDVVTVLFAVLMIVVLVWTLIVGYLFVWALAGSSTTLDGESSDVRKLERVEALLREKKDALHIEEGYISKVAPRTQRSTLEMLSLSPRREGIQITITIPTYNRTETRLWFEIPPKLTDESMLEKFLLYNDLPVNDTISDDLSSLIGKPIPVRLNEQGEWETSWYEKWLQQHTPERTIRDRLSVRNNIHQVASWTRQKEDDTR